MGSRPRRSAEYIRARAQLILAKAGALDPAIGRRHTAPDYEAWIRDTSALLTHWDDHHVLSEAVSWSSLRERALGMIEAL